MRMSDWSSDVCSSDLIVERLRRSLEGGVVEPPLGRRALPDEFCEVTAIGFISPLAAIGGEVELVPPGAFGLGRQRSEESRDGKECVSTCSSRWSQLHLTKKQRNTCNHDKFHLK